MNALTKLGTLVVVVFALFFAAVGAHVVLVLRARAAERAAWAAFKIDHGCYVVFIDNDETAWACDGGALIVRGP